MVCVSSYVPLSPELNVHHGNEIYSIYSQGHYKTSSHLFCKTQGYMCICVCVHANMHVTCPIITNSIITLSYNYIAIIICIVMEYNYITFVFVVLKCVREHTYHNYTAIAL